MNIDNNTLIILALILTSPFWLPVGFLIVLTSIVGLWVMIGAPIGHKLELFNLFLKNLLKDHEK